MGSALRPPGGRITVVTAVATVVLAGLTPLAAQAHEPHAPAPVSDTAAGTLPGQRGSLLTERTLTGVAALPSAAENRTVTYLSEDSQGRRIVVSGTVSLPKTPPPPGGWPVISWAHGTTGLADICAPSADTPDGPEHEQLAQQVQTLDQWVTHGYAVVRTDYEGLGTPGDHPYLNGRSAANTVVDLVRAARRVDPRVGRRWLAVGHSQGGHAALFSAAAASTGKDVQLVGAVAIAPGGWEVSQTVPYIRAGGPGAQASVAFLPPLLLGAAAADPAVVPEDLLTKKALPLITAARTGCLESVREVAATIPPEDVFKPDADVAPLTDYLKKQETGGLKLRVPTFVAQGADDQLVARSTTDDLVKSLRKTSRDVSYRVYPGADHRGSIAASWGDAERFADALFSQHRPNASR
ncbi:lysophospholipase [Streptomyces sp. NBC_01387]|uniref:alpha/beta hydrolase family protein n=1 Tax=unclassified Streptomyces TaxID=2593676 RepID=UPI00202461D1|nr:MULTISPECIES: lipase family protein [unclassified Streptomyces]MCX4552832.1 lysophospholipase [Streptomyces sp. NBC_01500]WSC24163.1 lysophospholipase [Streptomyces sp. NBC_01766]